MYVSLETTNCIFLLELGEKIGRHCQYSSYKPADDDNSKALHLAVDTECLLRLIALSLDQPTVYLFCHFIAQTTWV